MRFSNVVSRSELHVNEVFLAFDQYEEEPRLYENSNGDANSSDNDKNGLPHSVHRPYITVCLTLSAQHVFEDFI